MITSMTQIYEVICRHTIQHCSYDDCDDFYFQDMASHLYNGPNIVAAEMAELYPPEARDVAIIDVAAGSGLAGECVSYFNSFHILSISHGYFT